MGGLRLVPGRVGRAVVHENNFAGDAERFERARAFFEQRRNVAGFVARRQKHGKSGQV